MPFSVLSASLESVQMHMETPFAVLDQFTEKGCLNWSSPYKFENTLDSHIVVVGITERISFQQQAVLSR